MPHQANSILGTLIFRICGVSVSIVDRHVPSLDKLTSHGVGIKSIPLKSTCLQLGRSGSRPSSTRTLKLGLGSQSHNPNFVGNSSARSANPLTYTLSLFPHHRPSRGVPLVDSSFGPARGSVSNQFHCGEGAVAPTKTNKHPSTS